MGVTTNFALRFPASTDQYLPHTDIQELATDVDGALTTMDGRVDALETNPAWSSYTPAWTSSGTAPALGNGTLTGAYIQHGSTVHVRIVLTLGSTSTVGTGLYRFSLPVGGMVNSLLLAIFKDASAGTARFSGTCEIVTTGATGDNMRINVDSNTGTVGAAIPVVPAVSDQIIIAGTYEAA